MSDNEYSETEGREQESNQEPEIKVKDWKTKFVFSEKLMKDEFLPKYRIAKARLRAEYEVKNRGGRKMTHDQVNITQSIGTNFVNSVYFKSPNCNLTAREEVEHDKVENTEIKVNDWLSDNKVKTIIKRNIWDAFLGGFGAVFLDYEYVDAPSDEPIMDVRQTQTPDGRLIQDQVPMVDEMGQPRFKPIVLKNK